MKKSTTLTAVLGALVLGIALLGPAEQRGTDFLGLPPPMCPPNCPYPGDDPPAEPPTVR